MILCPLCLVCMQVLGRLCSGQGKLYHHSLQLAKHFGMTVSISSLDFDASSAVV